MIKWMTDSRLLDGLGYLDQCYYKIAVILIILSLGRFVAIVVVVQIFPLQYERT